MFHSTLCASTSIWCSEIKKSQRGLQNALDGTCEKANIRRKCMSMFLFHYNTY